MRLVRLIALACFALAGGAAGPARADVVRAVRVVSQTVGSDELLLALAEPAQVAALSHIADAPEFSAVAAQARAFPRIDKTADAEGIIRYGPTLVLFADYSRAELVEQVRRAGVKVLIFDRYKTLEDAYANLRRLAVELGAEARAEAVIADCEARVRTLRERLHGVRPVRVIAPSTYGVIPGSETTFQDLCDYAGAENLGATLGRLRGHEAPPNEQMLTWPVERVVLAGGSLEEQLALYRRVPPYSLMAAVREGRAVLIEPWQLSCVTHLRVNAYERLARALHPEVFP
ncbi:MAG: ABC transporter substrate-binding protein [Opitutaceae bacterium]|nr:ABC transporter substrate-binding protein [Opitutaceae bacterium]